MFTLFIHKILFLSTHSSFVVSVLLIGRSWGFVG